VLEFETPEFFLLAFPLWYGFYRWGKLPASTGWLLLLPAFGVVFSWKPPLNSAGWHWTTLAFVQSYGVFVLPVFVWLGVRRWWPTAGVTGMLRLSLAALLLFGLAGPRWNLGGKGVDVVIVVDRSRSLPEHADEEILELIKSLHNHRAPGDRVAVVTFGQNARIDQTLTESREFGGYQHDVNPDGSDLDDALQKALNLVDPRRPARILVLSDGDANGPAPLGTARRARDAGVPIDFVSFGVDVVGDVAVRSLSLPEQVAPHEPFQFLATIDADGETVATLRLQRETVEDGQTVRKTVQDSKRRLLSGRNAIRFADVLKTGGTHRYRIEVQVEGDPRPQNNRWADEVYVAAGPRLLLLVKDDNARTGRLAKIMRRNDVPTDVRVAREQTLSKLQLDRYRAVVIEDVPADHLGYLKMARLANFVTERGGGLLMTGGENSFGAGGYYKSPLEEVLPVSMELRNEHRNLRAAIAVVLDRSGSMRVRVGGGQSKMDLANLGTVECVRLLSPNDMISVIAVDTEPHVEQPLTRVVGKASISNKIRSITSGGGGIYVDVALKAATEQLQTAKKRGYSTRHVILFSDANDTEISQNRFGRDRNSAYRSLIQQVQTMRKDGVTVSVIGLGAPENRHGRLLKDIAKAGGGNVMFTEDARDLPRLFTQDAMNVVRNTFLKKDDDHPDGFTGRRRPGRFLVGELGSGPFPNVDGYNLTYLKKETKLRRVEAAVISDDQYRSPWAAFWYRGLGRVAAIPFEVAGKYSGDFAEWPDAPNFLLTHVRWLLGGNDPRQVFVEIERQGQDAVVTLELDPRNPDGLQAPPKLLVIPPGAEPGKTIRPEFAWTGRHTLQARFRLDRLGIFRTQIDTGNNRSVRGPSISLPYSPEYFPRAGRPSGRETLQEIARLSQGRERADVLELLDRENLPRLPRMVSLLSWIGVMVILLLLIEIAGRRLALWERFGVQKAVGESHGMRPVGVGETGMRPVGVGDSGMTPGDAAAAQKPRWWTAWRRRWLRGKKSESGSSAAAATADGDPNTRPPEPATSMTNLLEQAKQRARRRRGDDD